MEEVDIILRVFHESSAFEFLDSLGKWKLGSKSRSRWASGYELYPWDAYDLEGPGIESAGAAANWLPGERVDQGALHRPGWNRHLKSEESTDRAHGCATAAGVENLIGHVAEGRETVDIARTAETTEVHPRVSAAVGDGTAVSAWLPTAISDRAVNRVEPQRVDQRRRIVQHIGVPVKGLFPAWLKGRGGVPASVRG